MTKVSKKGFITNYKNKILFFISLFLAIWSFSFLSYIFFYNFLNKETGFSTLSYNYTKNIFKNFKPQELTKGQKIIGEFKSHEDNLGSVSIRFNTFERANNDVLEFRIREKGVNKWYFTTKYDTKEFYELPLYPIGFPKIINSKNKSYVFELISTKGVKGKSVALSTANPVLIVKHNFSKHEIFKNPKSLILYISKKIINSLNNSNALFLVIVFFVSVLALYRSRDEFSFCDKSIFLVVFIGMSIRMLLAGGSINFDLHSFSRDADIFRTTGLIYQFKYYNYPPFFYFLMGLLDFIRQSFQIIPLQFMLRSFLSLIDLATLFVIVEIAKQRKMSTLKSAALFFLNPVTISISGHHGQFDNIAILFLLTGFYLYEKQNFSGDLKQKTVWLFLTLSLLVKQTVIFNIIQFYFYAFKNKIKSLVFLSISFLILGISFLAFINNGLNNIISHVINYGGLQGIYGITSILKGLSILFNLKRFVLLDTYKYIFIIGMMCFIFFVRQKDLFRNSLLLFLFFLTFTSGIGVQYFILPIALGVFFPTRWFYVYLATASLFCLGNSDEIGWKIFQFISWNVVWMSVILWFLSELSLLIPDMKKKYVKIVDTII